MNLFGDRRARPRGGRSQALPLLLTAFMLTMALLPLINSNDVLAKDDRPRITYDRDLEVNSDTIVIDIAPAETPIPIDIEIADPTTDGPIVDSSDPEIELDPEIEVMPSETPVIGIDPDVQVTAPSAEPGVVHIIKHACPAGYNAAGKSLSDLAADCQATSNGIDFGLSDGASFVQQETTGDAIGSGVQFEAVAPGPYSIVEQVPNGFAAPRVFCAGSLPGEGGEGASFAEEQVLDGNQIFHLIEAGESFSCDWFNIPGAKPTVTLPPSTTIDIDGDLPIIDLPDCIDATETVMQLPEGVKIDLDTREIEIPSELIDLVERGRVVVADRAVWTTTIVLPEGVKLIETDQGPAIVIPICDEVDAAVAGGMISIVKSACPIGFDASSADVYDLALSCTTAMAGIEFILSDGAQAIAASTTDANGQAGFTDVEAIPVSIAEQVPSGYGAPRVFCVSNAPGDMAAGDTIEQQVLDGNQIFSLIEAGESLTCTWFNIPTESGGDVVIRKYECPAAPGISDDMESHLAVAGCAPMDGVEFQLGYGIDTLLPGVTGEDGVVGTIEWPSAPTGQVTLTELIPAGYGPPVVYCTDYYPGTPGPLGYDDFAPDEGTISLTLHENARLTCWWINLPEEDGSVTIIKFTCPAGYNWDAYGADPRDACKRRTNGIDFTLTGNGFSETKESGSAGDKGKVVFADLPPGDYTVTESVPNGIAQVFVLGCVGVSSPYLQSDLLSVGAELNLPVSAGDHIVCRWYNVPDEHTGEIEVTKYVCATQQFVAADDCWLYEHGVDFALSAWVGGDWLDWGWDTTNAGGRLTFDQLDPGVYQIEELGDEWCYASADRTNAEGHLIVEAGTTTHVDVWNCDVVYEYETPTKFPNTGVGEIPSAESVVNAPVGSSTRPVLRPDQWMGVTDERLISFAVGGGERPVAVRIASVGINATTETLEIVDGEMQDPTGADQVAWYKESAKLGTTGNVVLAGHLNYWGAPEGVFYRLADVQVGDEIVVQGERGGRYAYRVIWTESVDAVTQELDEIVGPTGGSSLTLITCGGEWDPNAAEYNQRTVVRAELATEQ